MMFVLVVIVVNCISIFFNFIVLFFLVFNNLGMIVIVFIYKKVLVVKGSNMFF